MAKLFVEDVVEVEDVLYRASRLSAVADVLWQAMAESPNKRVWRVFYETLKHLESRVARVQARRAGRRLYGR